MAWVFLTLFLFLISSSYCTNLKEISSHKNFKRATFTSSEKCLELQQHLLTPQEKEYLLKLHSHARKFTFPKPIFMENLTWNDKLADMAQSWADKCMMTKNPYLTFEGQLAGQLVMGLDELLVRNVSVAFIQWQKTVYGLKPEIIRNYEKPKHGGFDYSPAAQILWGKTSQIGCGRSKFLKVANCDKLEELRGQKKCENKTVSLLVCNYFPGGNKEGEPVYLTDEDRNTTRFCEYDSKQEGCKEEKRKINTPSPIDRIRERMIQLWPAAGRGISLRAKWESLFTLALSFLLV